MAIVAINQLPNHEDTLLLRLLGKGQTQKQAIDRAIAFDTSDPRRAAILRLLANWKISLEIAGQVDAEEGLMMALPQAYLEWEQQTEQRGEQRGALKEAQALILRQLVRRIGTIAPAMQTQIQSLSLIQLENLGEALLDFSSPTDLPTWLQKQKN
ncbi:DUF4351 domain-containing protein [Altericista sp. CCNU0014]|uniref:DUF4351 domain-containing protein n=1 Tax=Altericista sp. CCNU0014 TaxID=3082949 RepID=UPI00384BEFFB